MISNYIVSPGFTIENVATLSPASSGFTYATPIVCTVSLSAGVQPADLLNLYSLFLYYGDNTEEEILQVTGSALQGSVKTYNWPGQYEIKLAIIPKDGSAIQTFSNNFKVYNYVKDSLVWDFTCWPDLSGLALSGSTATLSGALFHGYQSCPPGPLNSSTPLTFKYNISNVNLQNIVFDFYSENSLSQPWEVVTPDNKYAQLRPRWRFTDVNGNVVTSLTATNYSPVYIDSVGHTTADSSSGILVGYTGSVDVYYIDDIPSLNYYGVSVPTLWIVYNTNNVFNVQDTNDISVPSYSNSTVFLSTQFYICNLSADHLGISVNGGNISLPSILWPDTDTQFFATVNGPYLSSTDFSNKVLLNYPVAPRNATIYSFVTPATAASIYTPAFSFSRYDSLNRDTGGYYKNIISTLPLSSAALSSGNITATLLLSSVGFYTIVEPPVDANGHYTINRASLMQLSAVDLIGTYNFNVTDYYKKFFVRKVNENFNYGQQLQTYALQDFIAEDTNLMLFLSALGGDNIHPTENYGTTAYEKTANFVANTQDVNVSNVNQFYSLAGMIDADFDNYNYNVPPALKRQFDLFSTPHERLWGTREKWNTNFDVLQGHTNLGTALTAYAASATVTAGDKFVINDIFYSNFYELIEVPIITSYNSITANNMQAYFPPASSLTFPLTSYPLSSFFGWGLKTPILNNYKVLYYDAGFTNTPVNNLIDWNQPTDGSLYTTLSESVSSLSAWYADNGILENIYSYNIMKGLNLVGSKYYQPPAL